MTPRAARRGGTIPRLWLLPMLIVTALLGVAAAGVLSRSLVLDLIAWWPAWVMIALMAILARGRKLGRVRLSGLVPLVASVILGLFAWGHLEGWPVMPSASQSLVGPHVDFGTDAALSARVDGTLEVGSGTEFLYEVDPVRRGGTVGIPEATEQTQGDATTVVLTAPTDPGFMTFSGWHLMLSEAAIWSLSLEGLVAADLTGIEVTSLQASGDGTITVDRVAAPATMNVDGTFTLVVPSDVPVRIVGEASVPNSWEQLGDGWRSPASGEGWVVSPTGSSALTVVNG